MSKNINNLDNRQPLGNNFFLENENDTYMIEAFVGAGGTSLTYRARKKSNNQAVIIKEVYPKSLDYCIERNPETGALYINPIVCIGNEENLFFEKKQFALNEKEIVEKINVLKNFNNSPYVIKSFTSFEFGNTVYSVYDNTNAVSLEQLLLSKKIKPTDKLDLFLGVLDAVAYLHGDTIIGKYSGIIPNGSKNTTPILHLDLSPGNIMVLYTNDARICMPIDYGCSVELDGNDYVTGNKINGYRSVYSDINVVRAAKGYSEVKIGKTADVFSLGVILFELLMERLPSTDDLLYNTDGYLKPNEAFDLNECKILNEVLKKALHYDENKRYQNVVDFYNALKDFEIYRSKGIDNIRNVYEGFIEVLNNKFKELSDEHKELSDDHAVIIEKLTEISDRQSYSIEQTTIRYFYDFIIKLAKLSNELLYDVESNIIQGIPQNIKVKIVMPKEENFSQAIDVDKIKSFYENYKRIDNSLKRYKINTVEGTVYLRGIIENDTLSIIDFPDFYVSLFTDSYQLLGVERNSYAFQNKIIELTTEFETDILNIIHKKKFVCNGLDSQIICKVDAFLGNVEFERINIDDLEETKKIIFKRNNDKLKGVTDTPLPTVDKIISDFKEKKRNVYLAEIIEVRQNTLMFSIPINDEYYSSQWALVHVKNIAKIYLSDLSKLFEKGELYPIVIFNIEEQVGKQPKMQASLKPIWGAGDEVVEFMKNNEFFLPMESVKGGISKSAVLSPNVRSLLDYASVHRSTQVIKAKIKFRSARGKFRLENISIPYLEHAELQRENLLKDVFGNYKKELQDLPLYIDIHDFEKKLEIEHIDDEDTHYLQDDFPLITLDDFEIKPERYDTYNNVDYTNYRLLIAGNHKFHESLKKVYSIFGNRHFTDGMLRSVGIYISPEDLNRLVYFQIFRKVYICTDNRNRKPAYLISRNFGNSVMNGMRMELLSEENMLKKTLFLRSMSIFKFTYMFFKNTEIPNDLKWGVKLSCDSCSFRATAISESKKVIIDSIVSTEDMDALIDKIQRTNQTLLCSETPYELYVICHTDEILEEFIRVAETIQTESITLYVTTNKMYEENNYLYRVVSNTELPNNDVAKTKFIEDISDENFGVSSCDEVSSIRQPSMEKQDPTVGKSDNVIDAKDVPRIKEKVENVYLSQNHATSTPLKLTIPMSGPFSMEHIDSITESVTSDFMSISPYELNLNVDEKCSFHNTSMTNEVKLADHVFYKSQSEITTMDIVARISELIEQKTSLNGELRRTKGIFEGEKRKTLQQQIEAIDIEIEHLKKLY